MKPRGFRRVWRTLLFVPVWLGTWAVFCAAREHSEGFDSEQVAWAVQYDKAATRLLVHQRTAEVFHQGVRSENIQFDTTPPLAMLRLEHALPPSVVIDELRLLIWYRSNRDGATLAARVVCPQQRDPRTGDFLKVNLEGDAYTKPGQWQQLTCRNLKEQLQRKLPLLRKQLSPSSDGRADIDLRGAYVDRAMVQITAGRGTTDLFLDEMQFGPIVSPGPESTIQQTGQEVAAVTPEVEFRLDRLLYNNREFFPRVVPHHGESPDDLAAMRFNIVWAPDYQDGPLLKSLRERGLGVMATPPRAATSSGELLDEARASLAPFGPESASVNIWNLGTRIPSDSRAEAATWGEQVRNADRQYRRPLMADVAGDERAFSRQVSILSVSRPVLQGTFSLKMYRDWLIERRNLAQPGTFLQTWTQTEPVRAVAESRQAGQLPPLVVEPEQLRLQLYAALSAGCRGIGWWTYTPLDDDTPANRERKLMLTQLNMELELVEPWLATGTLQTSVRFSATLPKSAMAHQLNAPFGPGEDAARKRRALLDDREYKLALQERLARELEAATIDSPDYGMLVLPVWYGEGAQCVPGQLAASDATITIPGVGQSDSIWEISTTSVRNLQAKPVAGGRQVTLSKFDMTTMLVVTSDQEVIKKVRKKMETLRERSAQVSLELARAKLSRVVDVDRKLRDLKVGQLDSPQLLSAAQERVKQAQEQLRKQNFDGTRLLANEAMQLLRVLQFAYWTDAVSKLSQPTSSPHAVCFNTLPEHWRMISRFGKGDTSGNNNVLPSGNFEDINAMVSAGWKHEQTAIDGVRAAAELSPHPHRGTHCLRLVAQPDAGQEIPMLVEERPVTVTTPPVEVRQGQIVYIGGWIKVVTEGVGNLDGVMVYDSIGGATGALRWRKKGDWRQFSLLREVPENGTMTVTLTLSGLGEVYFDDLQIIRQDAGTGTVPDTKSNSPKNPGPPMTSPWDLLKKLPGI